MHTSNGIPFNHESPRRGPTFVTHKITMAAARTNVGLQNALYLGNMDTRRDWGFAGDLVIDTGETYSVQDFCEENMNLARQELAVQQADRTISRMKDEG